MLRHVTLWYVTDRHIRINVMLRFLTLRYVTWGWKTRINNHTIGISIIKFGRDTKKGNKLTA